MAISGFRAVMEAFQGRESIGFVEYVMYRRGLRQVREIQDSWEFKNKQRDIVHLMAVHGHLYLFQELLSHWP